MYVGWRAAACVRAAVNLPELFVVGIPVVDETCVTVRQRVSERPLECIFAVDAGAVRTWHHADVADDQMVDQVGKNAAVRGSDGADGPNSTGSSMTSASPISSSINSLSRFRSMIVWKLPLASQTRRLTSAPASLLQPERRSRDPPGKAPRTSEHRRDPRRSAGPAP